MSSRTTFIPRPANIRRGVAIETQTRHSGREKRISSGEHWEGLGLWASPGLTRCRWVLVSISSRTAQSSKHCGSSLLQYMHRGVAVADGSSADTYG